MASTIPPWFYTHDGSEPELVPVDGGGAPSWTTIPAAALVWTEGMETWLPLSTFVPSDPWTFANVEVDVDVAITPPAASEEMGDVADEGDYYDGDAQDEESPAAAALRASPIDRFMTVAIPMSRSGFLTAAVLGFAHTIGEFGVVLMIGGNIPGKTRVLSIAVYDHVESLEYANAHILSASLLVFSFLLLVLVFSLNRRKQII